MTDAIFPQLMSSRDLTPVEGLSLLANKIRQASITREILEVVSGAEALT